MKKEYIKPISRIIKLEVKETLLAGSNPASLQSVEYSDDEADSNYDVL